jgi:hypothetical protein
MVGLPVFSIRDAEETTHFHRQRPHQDGEFDFE